MVPKVLIPNSAITKFSQKVREMFSPSTTNESITAKIFAANRLTRGWCQYYQCTSSPSRILDKVTQELFWEMAHWLGRKYKISMPEIMQRYRIGHTFGIKGKKLVMPSEYNAKRLRVTTWHNPYTAKEEIMREKLLSLQDFWSRTENRQGWMDLREEVILEKGTTCYVCGTELHPSEVEIDHSTKPRAMFKDTTEADRMKHLQPICTSCHRAKTKTDLKVLSRMR
jgi:5-methylcytosine-specific restriction endonuclease McrA